MAKKLTAKSAFLKKHPKLDAELREFIRNPQTKLWADKKHPEVYGAFNATGLRVFSVR